MRCCRRLLTLAASVRVLLAVDFGGLLLHDRTRWTLLRDPAPSTARAAFKRADIQPVLMLAVLVGALL